MKLGHALSSKEQAPLADRAGLSLVLGADNTDPRIAGQLASPSPSLGPLGWRGPGAPVGLRAGTGLTWPIIHLHPPQA